MGKTKKAPAPKLVFKDPPPEKRDYQWEAVAEQLRERPGEWALVHRDLPASVPWAVNAGRISHVHPDRGFQARSAGGYDHETAGRKPTRYAAEMFLIYRPENDTSKAKKNGGKR